MVDHEGTSADEQRTSTALDKRCKCGLEVAVAADLENDELLPDRLRRGLHVSSLPLGIRTWVHEHGNGCRLGHELTQQLQSLRLQHAGEKAYARDVAAGSVKPSNESSLDGIAACVEDDWNRRGCGLGRERRNGIPGDNGHRSANQFSRQSTQPIRLTLR